jgi:hypothetical protein
MPSRDVLGDLSTRSTLRSLPNGAGSRFPRERRRSCAIADRLAQSADCPVDAQRRPVLQQGRGLLDPEPRTVHAAAASTARWPGDPSRTSALSTSQSRTQDITHHEKTIGFVVVWPQIGGGQHRCSVPTFRITILVTSSYHPLSSKDFFQDCIWYNVICLTIYLLSRSSRSRPSIVET